jgi:hypothetical protein
MAETRLVEQPGEIDAIFEAAMSTCGGKPDNVAGSCSAPPDVIKSSAVYGNLGVSDPIGLS